MRLWQQLTLAMLLVAALPVVVLGTQAWELTGAQAEGARKQERERAAVALAREIGRWALLKSQALAGWTQLYPDLAGRPEPVLSGLLRSVYRATPGAVTVALVDGAGPISGVAGEPVAPVWLDASLDPRDPLSERVRGSARRAGVFLAAIERPAGSGEVRWSTPYVASSADEPSGGIPGVAVTARSPFGEPIALAVDLTLDELDAMLAERAGDERAFALLTAAGDTLLSRGPPPDGRLLRPLLTQTVATFDLADERRVGAVAAVPGVPWAVVLSEPDLPDPVWRSLRARLILATLLGLLVAVVAGTLLARMVARPVVALRDATRALARGELQRPVLASGTGEIVELSRAFDEMASQLSATLSELQRRRAEVEEINADLERRVIERTRALETAQAELIRAGQIAAVTEVGAGLAHDLNNPLASVLGTLQILRARTTDPSTRALLDRAETEAQRCRDVADVMLRVGEPAQAANEPRTSALAEVLPQAVVLAESGLRHRGIVVQFEEPPPDVAIALSATECRHAIAQVLQAVGAGLPPQGAITIAVELAPTAARIACRPSGPVGQGAQRDDFLAAGLGLWVARGVLDSRGGALLSPPAKDGSWTVVLPRA